MTKNNIEVATRILGCEPVDLSGPGQAKKIALFRLTALTFDEGCETSERLAKALAAAGVGCSYGDPTLGRGHAGVDLYFHVSE